MYCLDTNIIIDIFRGEEKTINEIEKIWNSHIFITSITLCELYKGAYLFLDSEEKIREIENFLETVQVVSSNKVSSKEFGKMYEKLKEKGKQVNDFNVLIASIVKVNNLTLVTSDKHFKNINIKKIIL